MGEIPVLARNHWVQVQCLCYEHKQMLDNEIIKKVTKAVPGGVTKGIEGLAVIPFR